MLLYRSNNTCIGTFSSLCILHVTPLCFSTHHKVGITPVNLQIVRGLHFCSAFRLSNCLNHAFVTRLVHVACGICHVTGIGE